VSSAFVGVDLGGTKVAVAALTTGRGSDEAAGELGERLRLAALLRNGVDFVLAAGVGDEGDGR